MLGAVGGTGVPDGRGHAEALLRGSCTRQLWSSHRLDRPADPAGPYGNMIPWLASAQPFPDVVTALRAPNGLLAASADLTTGRLLAAYRPGIFPWYADGEPVLWWSPDPRMVLYCQEFRVGRSFRKSLRRAAGGAGVSILVDRAFVEVMHACAAPRSAEVGTWITGQVIDAYCELHELGLAHSVETWIDGTLVG